MQSSAYIIGSRSFLFKRMLDLQIPLFASLWALTYSVQKCRLPKCSPDVFFFFPSSPSIPLFSFASFPSHYLWFMWPFVRACLTRFPCGSAEAFCWGQLACRTVSLVLLLSTSTKCCSFLVSFSIDLSKTLQANFCRRKEKYLKIDFWGI